MSKYVIDIICKNHRDGHRLCTAVGLDDVCEEEIISVAEYEELMNEEIFEMDGDFYPRGWTDHTEQ